MFQYMPLSILVDFDILVDLDWSMCAYIWDNYRDSDLIDQSFFTRDSIDVKKDLINRDDINLLKLFIDGDTDEIFAELITSKESDLLKFARVYDTLPLLVTMRNQMDYVPITIECHNEVEQNYINALDLDFNTEIYQSKDQIDMNKYAVIFTKYIVSTIRYTELDSKHIYVAAAKYNMDEEIPTALNIPILRLLSDRNMFHTVDLYKDIHFIN